MTEQIVDAEVVEETTVEVEPETHTAEESHSTAVEIRPASREVLMPMDTEQVIAGMKAYQELLRGLLEPSDWQGTGKDKFLKKSGWRKIARAFNLSVTKVSSKIERDGEGNPIRAEVVARATAPNGQVQDGDGYCSIDEPRFASEKGRRKLENDLRATATTRAKNRAISDLVGMGEVSAEEVDAGAAPAGEPAASDKQISVLSSAMNWLLSDPAVVAATWDAIKAQCGGEITGPVANALIVAIKARKDLEGPDAIATEQDRAAGQPDIPSGQESDQGTGASAGEDASPASSSPAQGAFAPSPDQVPAEGIESEMPADTSGLDLEREGTR